MKPLLIGLTGPAGCGKSTAAHYLAHDHGFVELAFADPMKNFCRDLFEFSHEQLYGKRKEEPDMRYPRRDGTYLTPRFALQTLGTEWARNCCPDIWVRYAMRRARDRMQQGDSVVISDVRFENEARAIRDVGGLVWKLHRTGSGTPGGISGHESERGFPDELVTNHLNNAGSKEDLQVLIEVSLS